MAKTVCASDYGGPSDPTSGTHGYHGDSLSGRMAFAELGMGSLLGSLPYRAKVKIDYNGRSVIAEKLDIGLGGPGCAGHTRAIDLWYETAQALGFNGLGPVTVTLPGEPGAPEQGGAAISSGAKAQNVGFEVPGQPAVGPLLELFGLGGGSGSGIPGIPSLSQILAPFKSIFSAFKTIGEILKFLTEPSGWIRIGKVLLGVFLLITGVMGMANISVTENVVKGSSKAAELAAIAA